MAAAWRSSAGTLNASSNSNTVTKPAGTADGDYMLALIYINDSTATITPPAGWAVLDTINTTITAKMTLYWKIASSEGASWQWSFSATARNRGSVHSFSGVDGTIPFSGHSVQGNGSGTNAIAKTAWQGVPGSLLVFLAGQDSANSSSWTEPSGMTERYDANGVSSHTVATLAVTDAGMSGSKTGTPSNTTDQNAAFLVSLIPSGYDTTYPIVLDVFSDHNVGQTTLTIPVTVPTFATNTCLVSGVVIEDESISIATVSSITHNGDALTEIDEIQAFDTVGEDYETSALWYRVAPDTGTTNLVITIGGSVAATVIGGMALLLINAAQSGQPNVSSKAQSSGAIPITTDVTTTFTNCLVIDNVDDGLSTDTPVAGASQTEVLNYATGAGELMHLVSVEQKATAGAVTMSWTNDDATKAWSTVAAAFKAVGSTQSSVVKDFIGSGFIPAAR